MINNWVSVFGQGEISPARIALIAALLVAIIFVLIFLAIFMSYFRWWIQSFLTRAGVGILDLVGMTFRKVKPAIIVPSKIMAVQAGLDEPEMTTKALEARTTEFANRKDGCVKAVCRL